MTRRRALVAGLALGLALMIVGCAAAIRASQSLHHLLIMPDASQVQISSYGWGEQRLTYHTAGPAYAWFFTATRNLAQHGWIPPVDSRSRLRTTPVVYWRISQFGFLYISELVALEGEPNLARITVRRQLIIPWRQLLDWRG